MNESKLCPFKKVIIKDSHLTQIESFGSCDGKACMMYQDNKCGLCQTAPVPIYTNLSTKLP